MANFISSLLLKFVCSV